jgi:hypothetical protein
VTAYNIHLDHVDCVMSSPACAYLTSRHAFFILLDEGDDEVDMQLRGHREAQTSRVQNRMRRVAVFLMGPALPRNRSIFATEKRPALFRRSPTELFLPVALTASQHCQEFDLLLKKATNSSV